MTLLRHVVSVNDGGGKKVMKGTNDVGECRP